MSVSLGNGCVNIDGHPLFIYSGEIINYRLPAALWRDRLEKLKAGALNTVSTYWAWNFHSAGHGEADFTSPDRHVRDFLNLCAQTGLYVIARPGPYVCNEWDLGGYPAWLLQENSGDWRSDDPQHLHFCRQWFRQIHRELVPFQQDRGGPIILEQIENEHRWNARGFLTALCDFAREDGITVPLIGNHDGGGVCAADQLTDGCDIYTPTLEFYRWRAWLESHWRRIGFDKPLMVLEYRCADSSEWGGPPVTPRWDPVHWYISQDRLFMALGANVLNHFVGAGGITPVQFSDDARVTSYADNAPISPWGVLTPVFYEMRLLGELVQSVNTALALSRPWPMGWGTDNTQVECLARRGEQATFLIIANHSNLPQEFLITLPGGRFLPEQGRLSVEAYRTQLLLLDADFGDNLRLQFSTHQIMKVWKWENRLLMVVYGPVGTQGYLRMLGQHEQVKVQFRVETSVHRQQVQCGAHQLDVYVASREVAERTWFVKSNNGATVPVFSNLDLVRWQKDSSEPARAELPTDRPLHLVFPDFVKSVQVNGQAVELTAGADGLATVQLDLPKVPAEEVLLGLPEARVEADWRQEDPTPANGWRKVAAWGPHAQVLLEPSTYEWIKPFEVSGELPDTLEFLGITGAEIAVSLNGKFLGVYPDRRLPGTNDRPSYNAIFDVTEAIHAGTNRLSVRMSFPGRHNSGRPIFAGLSQPVALRRGPRLTEVIPRWKVSPVSNRKWFVRDLDAMTGPPETTANWEWIDLSVPNAHRHSAGSPHWREARWYQTDLKIPAAARNRPLFLECPPVEEAWAYAAGRCLGHTHMASSSTFDLSEFSGLSQITLTLAVRHNWHGAFIGLPGPPRLVTADQVLDSQWWFRPGSQGLRQSWHTASSGWLPQAEVKPGRRMWLRQNITIHKAPELIAPLYVDLVDFKTHATVYWNGVPIGLYASTDIGKRFYIPDNLVQRENQLVIAVDGYGAIAQLGHVSVGAYQRSRGLEFRLTV